MKKLSKNIKRLIAGVIAILIVVASIGGVNAASKSIQLKEATKTKTYIAGVRFSYKMTTDGKYLYCLNMHKKTAQNTKANLVPNSKYIDGGLVYILKNGYPTKSITGNRDKDYYITQTAVWWYLDKTRGSTNLGSQFKKDGSDSYNMRKYVRNLVEEGYKHRNDKTSTSYGKVNLNVTNNNMTLQNDYYVSQDIKVVNNSNMKYKVSILNAPGGVKIVRGGTETDYLSEFTVSGNEAFKVKVPASNMKGTTQTIKVKVTGTTGVVYTANEYQPTNKNMQNVALLEAVNQTGSSEVALEIDSSKVTITKVDTNTKQALAGADLVLKDSNGNVITEWTSTINAHVIRNLTNGTYTIEEKKAPEGYTINSNPTTFTVSNDNKDVNVTIENAPKKVVVNIIKVDQATNSPLEGATLVVKNSSGAEIDRFVTTKEAHTLTDLENGTYTVEEISAPEGYVNSSEKIEFTIDDQHLSHQITFVNAKAVVVPNTDSTISIIAILIGLILTLSGIYYITGYAKKA